MSDEERKAINLLKSYENKLVYEISEKDKKAVKTILNLIEKQSKEIEELKENNKLLQDNYSSAHEDINWFCENYISKDKIKAKIEEYQKQIEKMEKDDIGVGFTLGKEWSDLKAKVEFGQSLLEKE